MKNTKLFSVLALLMVLFVPLVSRAIPPVGQCPANIGFEQNSFSGWTGYTGSFYGTYSNMTAGIVNGRHGITSSGVDAIVPTIQQKCPLPGFGSYSAKLGNSNTGGKAERLTTTMTVGVNNSALIYSWAAVMQDPGHLPNEQPRFEISIRDGSGNALSCGSYLYVAGQNIPFQTFSYTHNNYGYPVTSTVLYRDWSTFSVDLSAYIGQTVNIEYTTADCSLGGHFGYAYVDNRCDIFNIAFRNCPNDPYISLHAPSGFASYSWSPGNLTTQSIYVLSPGQTPSYTATLVPFNGQQCAVTLIRTISDSTTRTAITTTATNATCYGLNNGSATGGLLNGTAFGSGLPFTYSWATNPVQTSQTATGLAAGTYAVTMSDALGCSVTDTFTITQPPQPPYNMGSNSPVCAGGTLQLSADSFTNYVYSWMGPNGYTSNQRNPQIPNITVQQSGYYQLNIDSGNIHLGCSAILINVSVGLSAPVATSNSPVNHGATLNLSATMVNGATGYSWTGPNGYTANTRNTSIANATASLHNGVYTVVALSNGCPSPMATVSATINPAPVGSIISNSPVCERGNLYLTGSSTQVNNSTYSWTGPNGFTFFGQTPSIFNVTPAAQGWYVMTLNQPGLPPVIDSTYVTIGAYVYNIQASGTSTVCAGGSIQLSVPAGLQGATYTWSGPNSFSSSMAQTTVTPVTTQSQGVYSVTVTSPGCQTQFRSVSVSVLNSAIIQGSSNTPVCVGNNLNLSAQTLAGATYLWNGPNGFSSTLQTPSITGAQTINGGIYSLTANIPGCSPGVSTLTVAVNSNSATFGSNAPLCAGNTLMLSANTMAMNATYAWTGPNNFTSTAQYPMIPSVMNVNAGLYSVQVNVPGCPSVGSPLTVAVSSTSTIGATATTPICEGNTLQFGADLVTGATYSWTGPNGYTSNLRTPVIQSAQPSASGTYIVTATIPGCGTSSSAVSVTVGASPFVVTPATNSPVCLGGNLNLSATPSTGFTYSWAGPNGFTSNMANPTISNASVANAGEYTLTVSSMGCDVAELRTPQVVISGSNTIAASANGPLCQGSTLLLNASLINGSTYSWSGPNGFTSNLRTPSISAAQPASAGNYTVIASIPGCGAASDVVAVTIGTSATNVTVATNAPVCISSSLNLSANPATGFTYSWAGPDGFTSNMANPVISGAGTINAGQYTLTVSSAGCPSRTITTSPVTVVGSTITASANTPVCVGTTLQFQATNLTNASYAWAGPNGFNSSLRNPSILNAQAGVTGEYTVTATVPGCGVLTTTVNVTVGTNPNNVTISTSSPVCDGGSLNLSAIPATGFTYNWAGPNGFTSNMAQPVINPVTLAHAGEYTLIVGVSGCNNAVIRTHNLVVNSTGIGATVNLPSSCQGSTLNFAGNNVTGSTSFAWYGPDGWSSTLRLGGRVNSTPAMSGMYTFTANKPGCGIVSTTLAVTVGRVTTGVLAPNKIVCENSILQFTVSQPTGYTYSWTGPNGFTSNLAQPSINSVAQINAGFYNLTISSTGCSPTTRNPRVTVNSVAGFGVSSNSPICEGQNLYLSAPNLPNTTNNMYVWTGPASFNQKNRLASRYQMTTAMAGNYSLNMNIPGCGLLSGVVSVVVGYNPLTRGAASVSTPICINGTLNLTAAQQPTFSYSWSGPNAFNSIMPNPTIANATGVNAGEYSLTISSPGCVTVTKVTGADAIVNDPATLTASANFTTRCANQPVSFTATLLPNTTYNWSGPGGWNATGRNVSRNPSLPIGVNTYNLSANIGGCGVTTRTVSVTVNSCRTNQNANNGQNGNTNNDNINPVSGSTEGATPVSTLGNGAYLMSVSPNPFDGSSVNLHVEGLAENAGTLTVSVWEIGGRKITEKVISLDANTTHFDTALTFDQVLSKGYYILQTEVGAERRQLKLIVH